MSIQETKIPYLQADQTPIDAQFLSVKEKLEHW